MEVSALVEFEGDWALREQKVLLGAVADVEKLADLTPQNECVGKPWLCNCIRLRDLSLYMAHRVGSDTVLCAYGAVELSLEILEFGVKMLKERERIMA